MCALTIGLISAPSAAAVAAGTPEPSPSITDPAASPTPAPAETESATPTPAPQPEPSVDDSPTPSPQPAPEPEPTVDPSPEADPSPAPTPGEMPTPKPTPTPELEPSPVPESAQRMAADIGILAAGIPEPPAAVWSETFETGVTTTTPSALTAYAGGRFTASTGWAIGTNCTGVIVNYSAQYPNASFCPTQPYLVLGQSSLAARDVRRLADVLGQVAAGTVGSTSATAPANGSTAATQSNHALVADPYVTVTGGTVVAQTTAGLGVTAPGSRYYTLRMDAAGAQCGTNNASLSAVLLSGSTTILNAFPTPVVPCAATGNVFYTSPTLPSLPTLGGILDPAWAASARAATYTGTTAALLTPAQISGAQLRVSNSVTGAGSAFGIDNLRVLDVSPVLDAAFAPAGVVASTPSTLTFTITNSTDLLAKSDWGFSNALPSGLVVAPTPAIGGTCANVTGTAFAVTAAAGSSTISAVGGDLASGAASCTITVNVVAAAAATYASGTATTTGLDIGADATLTVSPATTITVRKNITSRTAPSDQFTLSVRSGTTVLASATTTGSATGIQPAQVTRVVVQPNTAYTIHEAATSGPGLGYAATYECVRGTTVIAAGAAQSGSVTTPADQGAEIVCTFTNTPQTVRLACDNNRFYSVSPTGSLAQGDIVAGSSTAVGTWADVTSANGLGIGAGGTTAYALDRSSDASDVASILKWTPAGGFQKLAGTAYATVANGVDIGGSIVAGAIDLSGTRYYFGKFVNSQFYIWRFTETNPAATRFQFVGSFPTGSGPNGNGDMAFDSRGNLYVVGAATTGTASSAAIYTVTAETIAAASGGTLAVGASTTKALGGVDASPAFGNVNGIAFSPRGTAYLSSTTSAYEFDPTTWTRIPGTSRVPVDSTDMGGCTSPATITVLKNVVGRLAASDQFALTLSNAGTTVATATTSGALTGRQGAQIGPVPAPVSTTLTFSEAMDAGSASAIASYTTIYECWADGVRLSTGTTTTGTVTMPNRLSVNVVCTYFNSPRPASTVTLTKQVIDPATGAAAPAAGWTLGVTAAATAGTATVLPSEAPRQQTAANGTAVWTVLYGSATSSATLTIVEEPQTGFVFSSGSCTVNGTATPITFTTVGGLVSGTIAGTTAASTIACTIINRPVASLTLVKRVSLGSALPTDWTLTAAGPTGALPGPTGRTGTAQTSGVAVTPGVPYRLSENVVSPSYVQVGTWTCVTATGATVTVTAAGDVTLGQGASVTCTVTNATATVTLLKQVQSPQPGFQAGNWTITATPAPLAGATLPTQRRPGAEYSAAGNPASTIEVRPNHAYTLSEAPTASGSRLAYRTLRLERLDGTTWTPVASETITTPAPGQTAVYRYVNAPVAPTVLPLTGGLGADLFLILGGALLAFALSLALFHAWRRSRRRL